MALGGRTFKNKNQKSYCVGLSNVLLWALAADSPVSYKRHKIWSSKHCPKTNLDFNFILEISVVSYPERQLCPSPCEFFRANILSTLNISVKMISPHS